MHDSPVNFEQRSVWELNSPMPTISELGMSSLQGSQLYPHYSSDTRQLQPYRQAWIPDDIQLVNNKTTQGYTPNKRCVLLMLGIGLLIGIVICGVPLAVMTTLYIQEKSQYQTATNTATNMPNTATNGSINQIVLPSQCTSYITNTDFTRNIAYTSSTCGCGCDSGLSIGWYRFSGLAGTRLSTFPSNYGTCSAYYPGWFNGSLPTTAGTTTYGNIYFNVNGYIYNTLPSTSNILATNCGDFYVFYLTPISSSYCYYRYCTT